LTQAGVALADVWAYVDEKGVAHFATTQVDLRYQLFARVDDTPAPQSSKAPAPSPVGLSANSRDSASAQQKKLLAVFEKSPDYAIVQTLLREASRRHEVSYELLQAVMATESGFNRHAVSPKGAVGLMQIMPATAQRFGLKPLATASVEKRLFDPALNIDTGARYLRYLTNLFPGEPTLALAAYNAGEGAVQRAGNRIPNYPETQQYVKTVMQLQMLLSGPTTGSGLDPVRLVPPSAPSMMVPGQVLGRSNMVQDLGSRSGRITFQIPAEPTNDALEK
jgi:soluble lytic murein transglycosylase-like protein